MRNKAASGIIHLVRERFKFVSSMKRLKREFVFICQHHDFALLHSTLNFGSTVDPKEDDDKLQMKMVSLISFQR